MDRGTSISIWFFIGLCLLVDGVLTLIAGLYQLGHPPAHPVVLYSLHANLWWGAVLAMVGVGFCLGFAPGRHRENK